MADDFFGDAGADGGENYGLFSQGSSHAPAGCASSTPRYHMEHLDLNSEADPFPNMQSYQEMLLQPAASFDSLLPQGRGRGSARALFRAPHSDSPPNGRGAGRGRSRSLTIGAGTSRGGGGGSRGRGAGASLVRSGVGGRSRSSSQGAGPGRGLPPIPRPRRAAASSRNVDLGDADDDIEEDEDNDNQNRFHKANWIEENTYKFCVLVVEQIRNGTFFGGQMQNRGYVEMCSRFHQLTGLRHEPRQLRNRMSGLKTLFMFWKKMMKQSGGGFKNGMPVLSKKWWAEATADKKLFECKKLIHGAPEYMPMLEEMFKGVIVDGSTSCTPGNDEDANGVEGEDADEEEEEQFGGEDEEGDEPFGIEDEEGFIASPMSTGSRKRASTSSTTDTAASPNKKSKSPMVKLMATLITEFREDRVEGQKLSSKIESSVQKCQRLARECGAAEDSEEMFMASKLFREKENRAFFIGMTTPEARLNWLKRWCQEKN
ncbi:unnamed protein product [Urochloa humidicola]